MSHGTAASHDAPGEQGAAGLHSSLLFSAHKDADLAPSSSSFNAAPTASSQTQALSVSASDSVVTRSTGSAIKRDRRLSRNARPSNLADGLDTSLPPLIISPSSEFAGSSRGGVESTSERASLAHSPTRPSRHANWVSADPRKRLSPPSSSPSSSKQRRDSQSLLPVSLHVETELDRSNSFSSKRSSGAQLGVADQSLSRAHSMRESGSALPSAAHDRQEWRLPSHHQPQGSPTFSKIDGRHMSPSTSLSLLSNHDGREHRSAWMQNARRWSSSLPRGRNSAAFAYRLAENASPYLRAGLEELRSIFDVDSNPIPNSPFIDDDDEALDAFRSAPPRRRQTSSDGEEGDGVTLSREASSMLSADGGTSRTLTASPAALSSRENSPSRGSVSLRRTPSDERNEETKWSSNESGNEKSSSPFPSSGFSSTRPHRRDSSPGGRTPRHVDHRLLATSLLVIAVGMTALCAWGYAMQSDTFSITLIGFFLTQPAFALAALAALLLRKRPWMDLFSRAIRAHVLAQALIVILAYLDLSASSLYVRSPYDSDTIGHGSVRAGIRSRFSMVPTMEMRFGPVHGAMVAGDTRDVDAATMASASVITSWTSMASSQATIVSGMTDSSIHAHDSAVGSWHSRLMHLIVFLVQAAAPIVMILVGQYVVAQRLAWLARQGSLSRQSSLRQQAQDAKAGGDSYVPGSGLQRPLPQLQIPGGNSHKRRTMPPMLRLPGESSPATSAKRPTGAFHSAPRHRRDEKHRRRLVTASGVPLFDEKEKRLPTSPPALPMLPVEFRQASHATQSRPTMAHRHNRSASQPVNLAAIAVHSSALADTPDALGMMFEEPTSLDAANMDADRASQPATPVSSAIDRTSAVATVSAVQ